METEGGRKVSDNSKKKISCFFFLQQNQVSLQFFQEMLNRVSISEPFLMPYCRNLSSFLLFYTILHQIHDLSLPAERLITQSQAKRQTENDDNISK